MVLPNCLAIVFLLMSVVWYGKADGVEADEARRVNVRILFDLLYATM